MNYQRKVCPVASSLILRTLALSFSLFVALWGLGCQPLEDQSTSVTTTIPDLLSSVGQTGVLSAAELKQFESRARLAEVQLRDASGTIVLPDAFRLELFADATYLVEITDRQTTHDGMLIWSGHTQSSSMSTLLNYADVTIILDPATGEMGVSIALAGHSYTIQVVDGDGTYRVSETGELDLENEYIQNEVETKENLARQGIARLVQGGEQDVSGVHIVDVFVGFSTSAAAQLGNIEVSANQMIAEVNNGLRNSQVRSVRLRLVGVGTTPNNPGVTSASLNAGETWFAREIRETAPDILSLVQSATLNDAGGGLAGVLGFVNVNATYPLAKIFRHEVGHNAGMFHCQRDDRNKTAYGYGWAVPGRDDLRTHMCGNTINFYSNPDVFVQGHRMGDPQTANAARVWRERAAILSSHRRHIIPFPRDGGDGDGDGGATFSLVNSNSGNCVGVANGSTADLANIQQVACNTSGAQIWEEVPTANGGFSLRNPQSKKCLDVGDVSFEEGANVILYDCNGGANQRLTRQGAALQFAHSGKCLDVNNASSTEGANIQQQFCNGSPSQSFFKREITGDGDDGGGATFSLVNVNSSNCVGVANGSTADLANIQQVACNTSGAQIWEEVPTANGGFSLRNPQSKKCLDVGDVSFEEGANVILYDCNGGANQRLTRQGAALQFAHSGKCLDVNNASSTEGANIQQQFCNGSPSQSFFKIAF